MEEKRKIRKLEENVVNRIAAGEVIQRPANAVKELIENCLDAGATTIQVILNAGGLKKLSVIDNGSGIQKDDMEIVCERFTTSKLSTFEDLSSISTYGFRGEALASISHVAHLTITTKTNDSCCAYKASYHEGKVKGQIKPCAGNQGTQIMVEDLFYNVPVRRKALQNAAQEHGKVADMLGKYAIHNSGKSFQLQKVGNSAIDLKTMPDASTEDNIRNIYGNTVARELLTVNAEDENLKFKMSGHVSNANYSAKRMIFILFINHRLVDSSAMRKVIDSVYALYLPKKGYPFIYLSLEVAPENVDVNVHPTKHEVHFLHEERIMQKISEAIETVMLGANTSRTFYVQSYLPSSTNVSSVSNEDSPKSSATSSAKLYDHQLVRTDHAEQKLDAFITSNKLDIAIESTNNEAQNEVNRNKEAESVEDDDIDIISTPGLKLPTRREVKLTSVLKLQKEIGEVSHAGLRQMFRFHKFGACINKEHSLIQYKTGLYLVNVPALSEELFYQLFISDFANFGVIKLEESLSIKELAIIALNSSQSGWNEEHGSKEELADFVVNLLTSKAEMLQDYYSMNIDQDGNLLSLPMILDSYIPDMSRLPMFLLRLATEVNWDEEKDCFESFAREAAKFYHFHSNYMPIDAAKSETGDEEEEKWKWIVEHVIFATFKASLQPPRYFVNDGSILEIAELSRLYKVFERC